MKNTTKFKIINWIKKILKYKEPIFAEISSQKMQLQTLEFKESFPIGSNPEFIDRIILGEFVIKLKKIGAIQIKEEPIIFDDYKNIKEHTIHARMFFCKPPLEWNI